MSKYMRIEVQLKNEATLREALATICAEQGIEFEQGHGLTLYGYQGDARPETAEYVIRRKHIGRSANDLGFAHRADGSFEMIISEYDSRTRGMEIARAVKKRYTRLEVEKLARARGLRVEEVKDNGVIRLRFYPTQSRRPARQHVRVGR